MADHSADGEVDAEPGPEADPRSFEAVLDDAAARPGDVVVTSAADHTVVALSGDADLALAADLAEACRTAVARALPVRLDVSAVTFIDSTAIGYVVILAAAERDRGRTLELVGASRRTADTFRLTGLGDLLGLAD